MSVCRWALLVGGLSLSAAWGQPPATTGAAPAELLETPYLYNVVRHLYRWYLDERDLEQVADAREFVFRVRGLRPVLDEGDRSRFGEITLPQLGVQVRVKQADYTIPELNAVVRSEQFKVVAVSRIPRDDPAPPGTTEVKVDFARMRDELYRTRRESRFPEGELLERLRSATRRQFAKDAPHSPAGVPAGPQVVHLAPLSPVANEAWVFWETGRRLIRFASDIDLANPAVWDHEDLAVRLYDIDEHVVVSLDEVPGSNAYLTRAQVGRALYNCIVLGRRMELQPPAAETAAPRPPR